MKKNYYIGSTETSAVYLPAEIREVLHLKQGECYGIEVKDNSITFSDLTAAKRAAWIDMWHKRAMGDRNAIIERMNDITAVGLYDEIGISKPSRGDKYDERTGIAVAYAKTHGVDIPKYI